MTKFTESFLDDLRSRLPVSSVVGRYRELIRKGHEHVVKDDQSISVNDAKKLWYDFGKNQKGGDIFDWIVFADGVDFVEAVKRCAGYAGIAIESDSSPRASRSGGSSDGRRDQAVSKADARPDVHAEKPKPGPRQIVATYDYTDEHGRLIYQVVRYEPKGFSQRRPYHEETGVWVWGLDSGEYMRYGPGKDWVRYDEKRYAERGFKQKKFIDGGIEHGLYRLPDLLEAIDSDETVWLPEGEKDVHTLGRWDLVAATNSGGAKHWSDRHAAHFRNADVIIPIDHDDAGRERGHKLAASLKGIAKRVRILDLSHHWTGMPEKADITDWQQAGGTRDKLLEIVERLPEWTPAPPPSTFGALRFVDLDLPAREHEWLIKGVLPRCDMSIIAGEPGSGKSFAATDIGFAIARAALDPSHEYMGRKVRGGLALYQAGEGGLGLRNRMRAYRQYHGVPSDLNLPFVLMPQELNLFSGDDPVNRFIEEAKKWSSYYELPVEIVTVDTFSAATTGANENMAEDMTKALNRGKKIADALNTHVQFVHHWNKAGSLRGWSGLRGNVETVLEVEVLDQTEREGEIERPIRIVRISKQKDGVSGLSWKWTLPAVEIAKDVDGDPVTSCIVRPLGEVDAPAATVVRGKNVGVMLNDMRVGIFRALLDAVDLYGEAPPAVLGLPASITKVTKLVHHYQSYTRKVVPHPENAKANQKTLRSRMKAFREFGVNAGIIGVHKIGGEETADAYIWATGKPVFGRGLQWPPRSMTAAAEEDDNSVDPVDDFWGQ